MFGGLEASVTLHDKVLGVCVSCEEEAIIRRSFPPVLFDCDLLRHLWVARKLLVWFISKERVL